MYAALSDFGLLLVPAISLGIVAVYLWPIVTGRLREPVAEPAPEIPPLDPMVLCPDCSLLGYHSLDEVAAVSNPIRVYETPDGDTVEINVWGGGTPGHWRRQCCFCDHTWSVPLNAEEDRR